MAAVQARSPSWTWRVSDQQLNEATGVAKKGALEKFESLDVRPEDTTKKRWWIFDSPTI